MRETVTERERGREEKEGSKRWNLESELTTRSHELKDGCVSMYCIMPAQAELMISDLDIKPELGKKMILLYYLVLRRS